MAKLLRLVLACLCLSTFGAAAAGTKAPPKPAGSGKPAAPGKPAAAGALKPADRKTLSALCSEKMPDDDALSDCAKATIFNRCGRLLLDQTRFRGKGALGDRIDDANKKAVNCQSASSYKLPVAKYSWSTAVKLLNDATSTWSACLADKAKIMDEVIPAYDKGTAKIPADVFKPANATDVKGLKAFCQGQKDKLAAAAKDPANSKMSAYQKDALKKAAALASDLLGSCSAATRMIVAVANEAGFAVATVRRILSGTAQGEVDKKNAADKTADLIKKPRFTVDVVVKSFIAKIGSAIGTLPGGMSEAQKLLLQGFAKTTDNQFGEDPKETSAVGDTYRLRSHRTFQFSCEGNKVLGFKAYKMDFQTGYEPARGVNNVHAGDGFKLGLEQPLNAPPSSTDSVFVSWGFKGSPNPTYVITLPFTAICSAVLPRDPPGCRDGKRVPIWIWNYVSGTITCKADKPVVALSLSGSYFPSHRLWYTVNDKAVNEPQTVKQKDLSYLWVGMKKDPTRICGPGEECL